MKPTFGWGHLSSVIHLCSTVLPSSVYARNLQLIHQSYVLLCVLIHACERGVISKKIMKLAHYKISGNESVTCFHITFIIRQPSPAKKLDFCNLASYSKRKHWLSREQFNNSFREIPRQDIAARKMKQITSDLMDSFQCDVVTGWM